jgi:hypothetical protein
MADDETKPTETTETTSTETSTAPRGETEGSKAFTQEQVDELIAKRVAKVERKYEKRLSEIESKGEPKPKDPPKPAPKQEAQTQTQPDGRVDDIAASVEQLKADLAKRDGDAKFAEAINEAGLSLDKKQREIARRLFDPEDVEGSMDNLKALGIGAAKPEPATETKEEPKAATYTSPGGANGPPVETFENNPTKWDRDYIDRLQQEGTFMEKLTAWRDSLPGGGQGIFRKRIPKVS